MTYRLLLTLCVAIAVGITPAVASVHAQEADDESTTEEPEGIAEDVKANEEAIAAKQAEIAELDAKINELKGRKATVQGEAEIIAAQLAKIEQRLAQAKLELRRTQLSIASVQEDQKTTSERIDELAVSMEQKREDLRKLLKLLYEYEQESLVSIFLTSSSLSEALLQRTAVQELEGESLRLLSDLREEESVLQEEQKKLEQQEEDLSELHGLLAAQQRDLGTQQAEQDEFLQAKKEQQLQYEQRLAEAQSARKEIEEGLFQLKNANIQLSFTEATDIARFAGKLTGVRPALLLGVLKVESNVGTNIGNGVFPEDMHPASREPFLRVTKKLGLDPYNTPISARPKSYSGWGGAMGPGQFMPQTWETIESRLAQLLRKPVPDPYNLTDAFVATAVFLADRGAADPSREYEAVNRYLAGPNWQRFTWYGDRVLAVAAEYEKEGL